MQNFGHRHRLRPRLIKGKRMTCSLRNETTINAIQGGFTLFAAGPIAQVLERVTRPLPESQKAGQHMAFLLAELGLSGFTPSEFAKLPPAHA